MTDKKRIAPERKAKIMMAQFAKATRNEHPHMKFWMNDQDTSEWWILLHNFSGNVGEYAGGEYLVRCVMPDMYPFKPPDFYFQTPNGVFKTGTIPCISIGKFHSENHRAALGVDGFCMNLISGLVGWKDLGTGIDIFKSTVGDKKRLARESHAYNREHFGAIIDNIERAYAHYSAKWPTPAPANDNSPADSPANSTADTTDNAGYITAEPAQENAVADNK